MPPSKRKRSGPGFSRDDPSSGPKRSKPAYNQVYRLPSRNISGPGIFVTCVQHKERKAALQFIDLLNEVADRIYPGVAPQALPEPSSAEPPAEDGKDDVEEEEDMDALRNGDASASAAVPQTEPAVAKEQVQKPQVDSDDIAAQIASELSDIQRSERSSGRRGGKPTGPVRFQNIETDTECFLFISVAPPLDPYRLVYTILADVEASGEPRSRFVQRLSPVSTSTQANEEALCALARQILPTFFPAEGPGKTFKIDPRIRSHSKLKRNDVIQAIASNIPTADPEPGLGGERRRIHNANLTHPDYWIVVEVVKNSAAISVVSDYERYKKLNLQSIAQAANEIKAHQHDASAADKGRIGHSLVAKSAPQHGAAEDKRHQAHTADTKAQTDETQKLEAQAAAEPAPIEAAAQDGATEHDPMAAFKLF